LESNLNPWRHSTYFDKSRPVASQNSNYSGVQNAMNHPFLPKSNTVQGPSRQQNNEQFERDEEDSLVMMH